MACEHARPGQADTAPPPPPAVPLRCCCCWPGDGLGLAGERSARLGGPQGHCPLCTAAPRQCCSPQPPPPPPNASPSRLRSVHSPPWLPARSGPGTAQRPRSWSPSEGSPLGHPHTCLPPCPPPKPAATSGRALGSPGAQQAQGTGSRWQAPYGGDCRAQTEAFHPDTQPQHGHPPPRATWRTCAPLLPQGGRSWGRGPSPPHLGAPALGWEVEPRGAGPASREGAQLRACRARRPSCPGLPRGPDHRRGSPWQGWASPQHPSCKDGPGGGLLGCVCVCEAGGEEVQWYLEI